MSTPRNINSNMQAKQTEQISLQLTKKVVTVREPHKIAKESKSSLLSSQYYNTATALLMPGNKRPSQSKEKKNEYPPVSARSKSLKISNQHLSGTISSRNRQNERKKQQ